MRTLGDYQKLFWIGCCLVCFSLNIYAGPRKALHDQTTAQYQKQFTTLTKKGYRLIHISGYAKNGQARYTAIFEKKNGGAWRAHHGMTGAQYQQRVNQYIKQGYQVTLISGFTVNKQARFAAIFEKKAGKAWIARHGLTGTQYQAEFNKHTKKGYRLTYVSGYAANGKARFAAIWEKKGGPAYKTHFGLNEVQYQQKVTQYTKQGYQLTHVSGYNVANKPYFTAIWEKKNGSWSARHNLNSKSYQNEFDNHHYLGYTLRKVSGYTINGKPRFVAIWTGARMNRTDRRKIHNLVNAFMKKHKVPGVSLAMVKNGKLVYARGFGYVDKANSVVAGPRSLYRIASISKPVTAVAIMKLVEQGKLKLTDKVFGNGGILGNTYGKKPYKKWITDIRVVHLLNHTAGGWSNKSNDPMFQKLNFGFKNLISHTLNTRPLSHKPGTKYAYSNFGYCILGRIIEKKTGQSYSAYVKNAILKKAGIKDMHIGKDKKNQRRWNETVYYAQDGGNPYKWNVPRMDAHGGWIASPIDLLRYTVRVDGFNTKPDILKPNTIKSMTTPSSANDGYAKGWNVNKSNNWWHSGSLPGTGTTLIRANNGYSWVILTNTKADGDFFKDLDRLGWNILSAVKTWPKYDLF